MRRLALLLLVALPLSLHALPWDYRAVYRSGLSRVPQSGIVEVGELDNYVANAPPMTTFLSEVLGKPFARNTNAESLPVCPGFFGGGGGYRLVVGPDLHEAGRGVFVLARACKRIDGGRVHARVRETYVYLGEDAHDRWVVRSVEQHRERDATPTMLLTRSLTGDVWSIAFTVLAAAAGIALILLRPRFGRLRWEDVLVGDADAEPSRWAWSSDSRVLPFVGGWAVALTIGCAWLLIAALSTIDQWTPIFAAWAVIATIFGACLLSTLHTVAMRQLPIRGPLVSTALGACAGWIAALMSQSIPGITQSGAVVGGMLYGAFVGVTNLLQSTTRIRPSH